jgi:hypothetical protein
VGIWHIWGNKMHAGFWWEQPEERALEKAMYRWEDNIKIDVYKITNKMYHIRHLYTFKI